MELSLQSKYKSKQILAKRQEMIENEKLHIKDTITYERFKELYNKYGSGLEEKEFAYAFLDIENEKYKFLSNGECLVTTILSWQYFNEQEFINIREKLIVVYDLKHGDKMPYEQLLEMYNKFGDCLSMQLFFEEVLGIKSKVLKSLKSGATKNGTINFNEEPGKDCKMEKSLSLYVLNPEYLLEIRKKIIYDDGFHIKENINYEKFMQLYDKYGKDMTVTVFAELILDISIRDVTRMKISDKTGRLIFKNVDVSKEYLKELQNKVVVLNKLEGGQLLEYSKLKELHRKYAVELLEKDFAVDILEIAGENYIPLAQGVNKSVIILSSRETNFSVLRKKVVNEENLHYDDFLENYNDFVKIHQKYAPNMREKIFAKEILDIENDNFNNLKYHGGRVRILLGLKLPNKKEIEEIRTKIILENNLHIKDEIGYEEFQRLHKIHGGIMSEKFFSTEVLLMGANAVQELKLDYKKNKNKNNAKLKKAWVLVNYKISISEKEKIKSIIKRENNLEEPRKMSGDEIQNLYNQYGGVMTFNMFLREILGVEKSTFKNVKSGRDSGAVVCVREMLNGNEIKDLKVYIASNLSEKEIAKKFGVTLAFLRVNIEELRKSNVLSDENILYEKVKVLKENRMNLSSIATELDISEDEVRILLERYREEKVKNASEESIRKKEEKSKRKIEEKSELIEKRAIKIMDEYINTEKNENAIKEYIQDCKRKFAEDKFEFEDLDFLRECILFVQGGLQEIEIFSRICIRFGEYENALKFIRENIMHNEKITFEEKGKLEELKKIIVNAENKLKAKKMLQAGYTDINEVAIATGASRSDVENLKKELISNVLFLNKFNTSPDDMDEYSNR